MALAYDLVGKKFNSLTVIEKCVERKSSKVRWLCKCDCGNYTTPTTYRLVNGITKSCGCKRRLTITHGLSDTRLYSIWCCMKKRCYNKNDRSYNRYGAWGITVCDEWIDDFPLFAEWALSNGYNESLTIERIDYTKGYSPDNCRWISHDEQAKNKRTNVLLTHDGETKILADWCRDFGVSYKKIAQRRRNFLKRGIDFDFDMLFRESTSIQK